MGRYIEDPQGMLEAIGMVLGGIGIAALGLAEATGCLTEE